MLYTPPACTVDQLSAGFRDYQIRTNYRGFLLTLTNTGDRSCTVSGYPGLKLITAWGKAIPTKVTWGGTPFDWNQGPAPVVLSPGETASSDIAFATYGHYLPGKGHPGWPYGAEATYLRVTPPGSSGQFTLRIPGAPVRVWHDQVMVTALAKHTPYIP